MSRIRMVGTLACVIGLVTAATQVAGEGEGKQKRGPGEHKGGPKGDHFARLDADGNGTISLGEFKAGHEKRMAMMKERMGDKFDPNRKGPDPEKIFGKLDKDGDGALTKEEMAGAREHGREHMRKEGDKEKAEPKKEKGKKGRKGNDEGEE